MRRLLAVFALALASSACGAAQTAKPQHVSGQPGYVVEVNGRRMYYECAGHGSPTVILEAGLGSDHHAWASVVPQVARRTRTCSYDRAGLGLSARPGSGRTGRDDVRDLHALLGAAGIRPPYVLAGHSFGGILVHEYADAYPREVAGIVFVDSSHPAQAGRFLAALGPPRHGESRIRRELRAFLHRAPQNVEGLDMQASMSEARHTGPIDAKPLIVVTAGLENDPSLPRALKRLLDRTWMSLQDDLARLSSNSLHAVALHSGHDVIAPTGQPELVAQAIRAVVAASRAKRPLPSCRAVFAGWGARCVSG